MPEAHEAGRFVERSEVRPMGPGEPPHVSVTMHRHYGDASMIFSYPSRETAVNSALEAIERTRHHFDPWVRWHLAAAAVNVHSGLYALALAHVQDAETPPERRGGAVPHELALDEIGPEYLEAWVSAPPPP